MSEPLYNITPKGIAYLKVRKAIDNYNKRVARLLAWYTTWTEEDLLKLINEMKDNYGNYDQGR